MTDQAEAQAFPPMPEAKGGVCPYLTVEGALEAAKFYEKAFAAETVHIIGRRRWNKRGAMVTDRYQHLLYHPDVADFVVWAREQGLPIVAVDNVEGSVPVDDVDLPERCVLLFGQEGPGLSAAALEAADLVVEITQYGSTRSINASAAAAIVMHEWVRRHARR